MQTYKIISEYLRGDEFCNENVLNLVAASLLCHYLQSCMKVKLLAVGKTDEPYLLEGLKSYEKQD